MAGGGHQSDFNPRSREGSDLNQTSTTYGATNFNPRSREGSDIESGGLGKGNEISIHAPVKGATRCWLDCLHDQVFQSTLP